MQTIVTLVVDLLSFAAATDRAKASTHRYPFGKEPVALRLPILDIGVAPR